MAQEDRYTWDLWLTDAGATGISFARGISAPTSTMLVHAAPPALNVEVRGSDGRLIAKGENLARTIDSPIARLRLQGASITREDIWPTEADYGSLLIVAGGEIGTLLYWWNDEQRQQWRWRLEFYNHR